MDEACHSLCDLFRQLGLEHEDSAVEAFIAMHRPLDMSIRLHEAPFWTPDQRAFLIEQWELDADWAVPIDRLDTRLRDNPKTPGA
jgi:hypothetical protein